MNNNISIHEGKVCLICEKYRQILKEHFDLTEGILNNVINALNDTTIKFVNMSKVYIQNAKKDMEE